MDRNVTVTTSDVGMQDIREATGSRNAAFSAELVDAAGHTIWVPAVASDGAVDQKMRAALVALAAFKPADEIEGMLAAQAVAMHAASMECSRRAMLKEQPGDMAAGLRKGAAAASRTFIELLAALDRKRGKSGQQKVTVEHVHVHAGGQAIVGNVEPGSRGGGGGATNQTEGEPGAPPARLAHDAAIGAIIPPLRCEEPGRQPVPRAGNGKRSMPHARGQIDGA